MATLPAELRKMTTSTLEVELSRSKNQSTSGDWVYSSESAHLDFDVLTSAKDGMRYFNFLRAESLDLANLGSVHETYRQIAFPHSSDVTISGVMKAYREIIRLSTTNAIWSSGVGRHIAFGWSNILERIIVEIGRLRDGWDGTGSLAPSPKVLRDVEAALSVLPVNTRDPEVEVDSSDGSVSIRWESEDFSRMLSLSFPDNGKAIVVALSRNQPPKKPYICDVADEVRILDAIEQLDGLDILTSR